MTPDALSALAGMILSVLMNYIPGLNTTFDRLTANQQRFAMGVLLAVSAVGLALWTCSDPAQGGFGVCLGATNWRAVVQSFVFALMANQATDRISPKKRVDDTTTSLLTTTSPLKPVVWGTRTLSPEPPIAPPEVTTLHPPPVGKPPAR